MVDSGSHDAWKSYGFLLKDVTMHWYIYSAIIGTVMFAYVKLFVRNMKIYKDSDYTMSWGEFVDDSLQNGSKDSV